MTDLTFKAADRFNLRESQEESDSTGVELTATETLAELEIVRELGEGGSSHVYLAKRPDIDHFVAIKIMNENLVSDPVAVKRFQQEAAALRSLRHPNIARVYDFGLLEDGRAYIVMEYIEGQTLEKRLADKGPLASVEAKRYFQQIAAALDTAHEKGILHRDVKPGNIIITKDHQIKLVDFGLARISQSAETQTVTCTIIAAGTPAYMSPEQCTGGKVDERSDIYSLGCVLYEALSGRKVFPASNGFACMQMHTFETPQPLPNTYDSDLKHLQDIAMQCLEKAPENRFQSMSEIETLLSLSQGAIMFGRGKNGHNSPEQRIIINMMFVTLCALVCIVVAVVVTYQQRMAAKRASMMAAAQAQAGSGNTAATFPPASTHTHKPRPKLLYSNYSAWAGPPEQMNELFDAVKDTEKQAVIAKLKTIEFQAISLDQPPYGNRLTQDGKVIGSQSSPDQTSHISIGKFNGFGPVNVKSFKVNARIWMYAKTNSNVCYVSDGTSIYPFDTATGKLKESLPLLLDDKWGVLSGIAFNTKQNKLLAFAGGSLAPTCIYEFDEKTRKWRFMTLVRTSGQSKLNGMVYSPQDDSLYALQYNEFAPDMPPVLHVMDGNGTLLRKFELPELRYPEWPQKEIQLAVSGSDIVAILDYSRAVVLPEDYPLPTALFVIDSKTGRAKFAHFSATPDPRKRK